MQEKLLHALRARRPRARQQWEALLRAEPVTSALGHPDALVHLIDWTLDEIFTAFARPTSRSRSRAQLAEANERPPCPCGRNPLLNYFVAGQQALREAMVLAQASLAPLDPLECNASLEELNVIFNQICRREIEAFCGLCQFRSALPCEPRTGVMLSSSSAA